MSAPDPAPLPAAPVRSLAARVTRRALDVLVIGWVAAVAVTSGRQFHDWWRAEEAPPTQSPVDAGTEWMARPLDITIGPRGVGLHRELFAGARAEVERRLGEVGRARCGEMSLPETPPDDAERELLAALSRGTSDSIGHELRATVLSTPLPAVAITRNGRLLGQAFAMPTADNLWTVFVLPRGPTTPRLTVPASATVLLSWTDPEGNTVCSLHGTSPLAQTLAEFDQLYGQAVIREVSEGATMRYQTDRGTIDVQLQPDGHGGWHGVLWISAPTSHPPR
jgi:hypothetical protein